MESSGGQRPRGRADDPAMVSANKNLRRVVRAAYLVLVLVKKHQPKVAALGVHLQRLLSYKGNHRGLGAAALTLSCRSMDPDAAVVHPLPRDHGRSRKPSSRSRPLGKPALPSSLSCRSMDPSTAVYRPREVQFSCKSTPPHWRRRCARRHDTLELEYHHGSPTAAVTRLFELMDKEEEEEEEEATTVIVDDDFDLDDSGDVLDLDAAAAWPALAAGPAPRQVRITDSPFPVREEDDEGRGVVDRRADEFITWFHEQLRTQQQRAAVRERGAAGASSYYWNR